MRADNLVSQSLSLVALSAQELGNLAENRNDHESSFVFGEVYRMLVGLADLKRSPLLDQLNKKCSSKPNDVSYFTSRDLACTAAYYLHCSSSIGEGKQMSIRAACKHVCAQLNGVISADVVRREISISDEIEKAEYLQRIEIVKRILKSDDCEEPSSTIVVEKIIDWASAQAQTFDLSDYRKENIKKAFDAPGRHENLREVQQSLENILERFNKLES